MWITLEFRGIGKLQLAFHNQNGFIRARGNMKTSIALTVSALILIVGLSVAPASAKPTSAIAFPIVLGVGY
jgi:hypothetical protein